MTPAQQAFYDLTDAAAALIKASGPSCDTEQRDLIRRMEAFKATINPILREHTAMVDAREAYLAANGTAPVAEEMARLCQRMSQDIVDVKPGTEREAFRALMRSSSHVIDACRSLVGEKVLQRAKVVAVLNKVAETDNEGLDRLVSHRETVSSMVDIDGDLPTTERKGIYTASVMGLVNMLLKTLALGEVEITRNLADGKITFAASAQEFRS